jgi:hypothetical protein
VVLADDLPCAVNEAGGVEELVPIALQQRDAQVHLVLGGDLTGAVNQRPGDALSVLRPFLEGNAAHVEGLGKDDEIGLGRRGLLEVLGHLVAGAGMEVLALLDALVGYGGDADETGHGHAPAGKNVPRLDDGGRKSCSRYGAAGGIATTHTRSMTAVNGCAVSTIAWAVTFLAVQV